MNSCRVCVGKYCQNLEGISSKFSLKMATEID